MAMGEISTQQVISSNSMRQSFLLSQGFNFGLCCCNSNYSLEATHHRKFNFVDPSKQL